MKKSSFEEVPIDKLRWHCDEKSLGFESTEELKACTQVIGQRRGIDALRLGLDIDSPGYNIFVSGLVGTGRKTAINCILDSTERINKVPDDKLYVNNFKNPDSPRLLGLPAGQGRKFKRNMDSFVEHLVKNIPKAFESESYKRKRKEVVENLNNRRRELLQNFEKEVSQKGFALIQVEIGPFLQGPQ